MNASYKGSVKNGKLKGDLGQFCYVAPSGLMVYKALMPRELGHVKK